MNDFIITNGQKDMEVVSHGTLITYGQSNRIEMIKYHKAKQGTDCAIGIIFNFLENTGLNPNISGGDVGMKELRNAEIFYTYEFNIFNIAGDATISIENQQCANFPGGTFFISFKAFALSHSEKGILYTISELSS